MRVLLLGVSALAILGACNGEKKPDGAAKSEAGVSRDYGQSDKVLAAMGLDASGGAVSFAKSSVNNGKAVFQDVTVTGEHDDKDVDLLIKTMTLEGLHTTDAGASFDRLVLDGVSPKNAKEGATLSIDEVVLDKPNAATGAFVSAVLNGGMADAAPPFSQWGFDRMSIKGANFSVDERASDDEDAPKGKVSVAFNEVSISSLADAVAGKGLMSGLRMDFDIPQDGSADEAPFPIVGSISFDKVEMDDIQGQMIDQIVAAGDDPEAIAAINMSEYATSPLEQGFTKAVMQGVSANISGLSFSMPKAVTTLKRNEDGVATELDSPKTNFTISADPEGGELGKMAADTFKKLGYDTLKVSAETHATYDPETDETRYDNYTLDIDKVFALSFNGGFFNLQKTLAAMHAGGESGPDMSVVQSLTLDDLELKMTDRTLIDNLVKVAAEMQGAEPEQMKAMVLGGLAMASMQAEPMGVEPALVTEAVTALSGWIENSGELTISFQPKTPLALEALQDPSNITKEALGFSAVHKQ